ncbi:MAG: C39 family peptidase [Clostridiaceae bacterium]
MKKFRKTLATLIVVIVSIFYSMSIYSETVFKNNPLYTLPKPISNGTSLSLTGGTPDNYEITNIVPINQFPELPTGCEITSVTMLLNWYGVNVNKLQLADAVTKYSIPRINSNGVLMGHSPNEGFIGNPYDSSSFGIYNKALEKLTDRFSNDSSLNVSNYDLHYLLSIVSSGRPVIAWVTIGFSQPYVGSEWVTEKNERVTWMVPEHSVLIIGYNKNNVIILDPYDGKRKEIDKNTFQTRYDQMGRQALTMRNNPRN